MRIEKVSFRANSDVEKFKHVHIEATASVEVTESPEHVLDQLKKFVETELLVCRRGVRAGARSVAGAEQGDMFIRPPFGRELYKPDYSRCQPGCIIPGFKAPAGAIEEHRQTCPNYRSA